MVADHHRQSILLMARQGVTKKKNTPKKIGFFLRVKGDKKKKRKTEG